MLAGFLLTAVRNWTKRPMPSGWPLLGLVALWLAGRVALQAGSPVVAAAIDVPFLPLVALIILRPIVAAASWRNLAFPPLLLLMGAANLIMHLGGIGWAGGWANRGLDVALDSVLLIIGIVGGRIVPLFTRNATGATVRPRTFVDGLALGCLTLLLLVDVLPLPAQLAAAVVLLAGITNLWRMRGWATASALRRPILAVLHAGYFWLGAGLVAEGLARLTAVLPLTLAIHLQTVGAIGTLTLGMLTRVALGHTGRKLEINPMITVAYATITAATIVRSLGPLAVPGATFWSLVISSVLWGLSFLLYLFVYVPILTRPRADGEPG